ncbi:MAG TPA: DUF2269 family protein [Acidimicrobiales bacterium]|nr:DUF2269 family protein [Acidimicrobiales bacterium]
MLGAIIAAVTDGGDPAVYAGGPAALAPGGHPAVYDVLVAIHVITAVIGFGAVAVSGVYGAIGRTAGTARSRPESVAEVRRFFRSGSVPEYLILVAPVFGIGAMSVRPGGGEFGQLWAVAGLVIWVAAGALLLVVIRPAETAIRASAGTVAGRRPDIDAAPSQPDIDAAPTQPDDDAALGRAGRRLAWAAAGSDVLFVIALLLMVTQPS